MRTNNTILMIPEALDQMSMDQGTAIMKLAMSDNVQVVEVYPKPFDLPDGYLSFVRIFSDGHREIGGIDDQGSVST